MSQTAEELARFSSLFRVYAYTSRTLGDMLKYGVQAITETLTRDHHLFNDKDETNSQVILVSSYPTFHVRNGPLGHRRWLQESCNYTREECDAFPGNGLDYTAEWPGNLKGLFCEGYLDEVQYCKSQKSHASMAIARLELPWTVSITATPIPYRPSDFGGILALGQNQQLDEKVHNELKGDGGEEIRDPYVAALRDGPNFNPANHKSIFTSSAFQHFIADQRDILSVTEVGERLRLLWSAIMTRHDYGSSCVIGQDHDGRDLVHHISDTMPRSSTFRVQLHNDARNQQVYDEAQEYYKKQLVKSKESDPDSWYVNGRNLRILNFLSICPMLHYVPSVHDVQVDDTSKPPNEHGTYPKKRNAHLDYLINLMVSPSADAPQVFLHTILKEMRENAHAAGRSDLFEEEVIAVNKPILLAAQFLQFSPRLQVLVRQLTGQVVVSDEKALLFCLSPFEQALVTAVLCCLRFKTRALLARMKPNEKQSLINQFNQPLSRRDPLQKYAIKPGDLEIFVLGYWTNSGLNLQRQCRYLHAVSIAPSIPVWLQAIGRIVRFGQPHECYILEYFVHGTHNLSQLTNAASNALAGVVALVCGDDTGLGGEVDGGDEVAVPKGRLHNMLLFKGAVYSRHDCSEEVKAHGTPLTAEQAIMRIFNASLGHDVAFAPGAIDGEGRTIAAPSVTATSSVLQDIEQLKTPHKAHRLLDPVTDEEDVDLAAFQAQQTARALKSRDPLPARRAGASSSPIRSESDADENGNLADFVVPDPVDAPSPTPAPRKATKKKVSTRSDQPSKTRGRKAAAPSKRKKAPSPDQASPSLASKRVKRTPAAALAPVASRTLKRMSSEELIAAIHTEPEYARLATSYEKTAYTKQRKKEIRQKESKQNKGSQDDDVV